MRRVWQDTCKPGEYSPTKGKWFAQESVDGHLVGVVLGPYDDRESAEGTPKKVVLWFVRTRIGVGTPHTEPFETKAEARAYYDKCLAARCYTTLQIYHN